jgi:hypothetical protein
MRPPDTIAPAAGGPDGGGIKTTDNDTRPAALPFWSRRFPADTRTLFALGALTWPQARARFMELGLPPEVFEDDEARALAALLLSDRDPTPDERDILGRDDGQRIRWCVALEVHDPKDPAWAVEAVDRFAAAFAGRWLPAFLRWTADRLEAGAWTLAHAAAELDVVLRLVRPVAAATGRAAA